jgi:hypothetical protein
MTAYPLLYYPDFQPDPVWLRRILLLADSVTRIVPNDIHLNDPDDLLALQDSVPGCLGRISPDERDITIESVELPRLAKAFAFLGRSKARLSKKTVTISISNEGAVSIIDHVFLHSAKVSPAIHEELLRNGLIISGLETLSGREGFLVVDEAASDLILSSIAGSISRRTGFDTITDRPIPFALNALNSLDVELLPTSERAEGALLSSLASLLIPAEAALIDPKQYRSLREAYSPIRHSFKELTAGLATINRLNRIQDPQVFKDQVDATVREFVKEYQQFRKSRYARNFKRWAPLYVGGLLSIAGTLVAAPVAFGIAGASLIIQVVQKVYDSSADDSGRTRAFNMLAALRKDIVRQSGIKAVI